MTRPTALVLPGRAYSPTMPVLFFSALALRDAGVEPVPVEWPAPLGVLVPPDEVRRTVAAAVEQHAPAYVVAKSMGTHAAPVVADRGMIAMGQAISVNFIRPITEGAIEVEARARHRGRTTWVWDAEVTDAEERLCALAQMTIAVRPLPKSD